MDVETTATSICFTYGTTIAAKAIVSILPVTLSDIPARCVSSYLPPGFGNLQLCRLIGAESDRCDADHRDDNFIEFLWVVTVIYRHARKATLEQSLNHRPATPPHKIAMSALPPKADMCSGN